MESRKLHYYIDEKEMTMDLALKFLTPSLRVKLAKLETDYSLKLKQLTKDYKLDELKKGLDVNSSDIESGKLLEMLDDDDQKVHDVRSFMQEVQIAYETFEVDHLKAITLQSQLKAPERERFKQPFDGAFWQAVNMQEVNELNDFFRKLYFKK